MRIRIALALLFTFQSFLSMGQNQLVLFYRGKVLARFSYGDDFTYKLKKSKKFKKSFITDVREFSVVTFNDTIPFSKIDRVSLKGIPQKRSLLSKFLITAGVAYFALDEVNNIIVQGNKPDLDPVVWKPALVLVSTGYALTLLHKRSQRIRHPAKLVAAPRGSPFYKSDD